jgi:tripartite-type tricarboxylate transporter receptor subunit TctC
MRSGAQAASFGRGLAAALTFTAAVMFAGPCAATADYPNRPVTLIVPYPPGGGVDAMTRVVAQKLSEALRQQFIVDNRGGAGGTLGTRAVAKANPDGYTLLLGHSGTISINPSLYKNAGYEPRDDFAPIGLVASMPVALIAHPSFPAKSIKEFIDLARRQPGKINLGTTAIGTSGYMFAELFKSAAGIDVTIIPYKGTMPVMTDLLGGHVPVAFAVLPPALGSIASGNLRAIAVTSAKRTSLLPDVPTVDEAGLPGFEAVLHYGLLAPAGTSKEIVDQLSFELRRLVPTDDVKKRIYQEGGDPLTSTPAEYTADIDKEEKKWGALVRKLGLKVD